MRKTKARWYRFWHCFYNYHRMVDRVTDIKLGGVRVKRETTYIGCECGKIYYQKNGSH